MYAVLWDFATSLILCASVKLREVLGVDVGPIGSLSFFGLAFERVVVDKGLPAVRSDNVGDFLLCFLMLATFAVPSHLALSFLNRILDTNYSQTGQVESIRLPLARRWGILLLCLP